MSVNSLVKKLKQDNSDFEFYPSTDEILNVVKTHIEQKFKKFDEITQYSLLDCGAGDGRCLNKLGHSHGDKYAIEKSSILINELHKDTYVIGTDFHETTLIDKEVDIIYCNPPYSEYEQWASKIIREANAKFIYLTIPERWKNSDTISEALKIRNVGESKTRSRLVGLDDEDDNGVNIIGSFDFLGADRSARAEVDVICIQLCYSDRHRNTLKDDPFNLWFDANFKIEPEIKEAKEEHEEKVQQGIVKGGNLIKTLVELYNVDMSELSANFTAVSSLNAAILKELNVDTLSVKTALKQRIKGLKNKYWDELFKNYHVINKKLTTKSLEIMKARLLNHMSVDFTASNCYAITGWCIKNANSYFDSQLIDVVETMVSDCNIVNYKSNHRVFKADEWRYGQYGNRKSMVDYGLDLRCIMTGQGGYYDGGFRSYDYNNGMGERGTNTINDLIVVANNLGFLCNERVETKENWADIHNQNIMMEDGKILMNVKVYKNGNLHIKFNKRFIQTLNVEFGRLKGWLKDKQQASEELNISKKDIDDMVFDCNIKLGGSDLLMLGLIK